MFVNIALSLPNEVTELHGNVTAMLYIFRFGDESQFSVIIQNARGPEPPASLSTLFILRIFRKCKLSHTGVSLRDVSIK